MSHDHTCILRASQENSILRPNALYFNDHFERSGLSSKICAMKPGITFPQVNNLKLHVPKFNPQSQENNGSESSK